MTHSLETWLIHMCDSLIRDLWMSHVTHVICERHDWFIEDMTHLLETRLIHWRHDSLIRDMTHLLEPPRNLRDITHSYAWRDSFMCVTWLVHKFDMIFTTVKRPTPRPLSCILSHLSCILSHMVNSMSNIWVSDATHMNESCHTYEWVMSDT